MTKLRVGTRSSLLALTQTRKFVADLCEVHPTISIEEVHIQTQGDISTEPLSQSTTPGLFVSELRSALLDGKVDFLVHSMKDLPAAAFPGIVTACVPLREDARDALVSNGHLTLRELPADALVGTSSPRRAAAVRRVRPDLRVHSIRGNVDTRIHKVRTGEFDATILAVAGLNRIHRQDEISEYFTTEFVAAAGQGALSIECRSDDAKTFALLRECNDRESELITTAERAVLLGLNAGCSTAIGASGHFVNSLLSLTAELAVESTGEVASVSQCLTLRNPSLRSATELGLELAAQLAAHPLASRAAWS